MSKRLSQIKDIRYKAEIKSFTVCTKRDFQNYFRIYKPKSENVENNYFYSPYFAQGDVIQMHEHYGDRINFMETIFSEAKGKKCLLLYLTYDYRLAAVNEEYYIDKNEFIFVKRLIEEMTIPTELYIAFMAAHFNQLAGKSLKLKPEHYHILIYRKSNISNDNYRAELYKFVCNINESNKIFLT